MRMLLVLLGMLMGVVAPATAQITVPNVFNPQTRIQSALVNGNFSVLGGQALNRTGGTMLGTLVTQVVEPDGDNTRDLGANGARFANTYSVLGNYSGTLTAHTLAVTANATISGTLGVTGALTGGTYNGQTISSAAAFTGTLSIAGTSLHSGVATFSAANVRPIVITRANQDAGIQVCSTGGSGGCFALVSNTSGSMFLQDDSDGTPSMQYAGNTITLRATDGISTPHRINTAGGQPGFTAIRTTGNQTGSGTITAVFTGEAFDPAASYNHLTGVFTAPVSGVYRACASLAVEWSGGPPLLAVVVNGEPWWLDEGTVATTSGDTQQLGGCTEVWLNAAETASLRLSGAASVTVHGVLGGPILSHFSMRLQP